MNLDEYFAEYRRQPGPETLLKVLREAQGLVYRLCGRVLRHSQDAEDAAQQVLLELIEAAPRVADAEHFRRWIHRASFHAALDLKRRQRRAMAREQAAARASESSADLSEDVKDAVHEAIAELQPDLRDVIVDRYFERQSLEEMANRRRCSTVAVWKGVEKARERLRLALRGAALSISAALLERVLEAQATVDPAPDLITPAIAAKAQAATKGVFFLNAQTVLIALGALAGAGFLGVAIVRPAPVYSGEASVRTPVSAAEPRLAALPAIVPAPPDGDRPPLDPSLPEGAVGRLGRRGLRHDLPVSAVAFSPDGKTLASCGGRELCLWNAASGREIKRVVADARMTQTLVWSPDGALVATGGNDHVIRLWPARGEPRLLRGHEQHVWQLAFSADGTTLASAASDSTLRLWDVRSGREIRTLRGHTDVVYALALRGDGQRLATRSQDGTVRLWDAATGDLVRSVAAPDHSAHPLPIAMSPDGKVLAFWSREQIRFLNSETGEEAFAPLDKIASPQGLAFSPAGNFLAWVASGKVTLWDVTLRKEIRSVDAGTVYSMAVSPDGRVVATAGYDPAVILWDAATGAILRTSRDLRAQTLAFSSDSRTLFTGMSDGTILLWSVPRP